MSILGKYCYRCGLEREDVLKMCCSACSEILFAEYKKEIEESEKIKK